MWLLLTLITLLLLITSCHHSTETSPPEFKAYENNPILSNGETGSFDEFAVLMPCAFIHEEIIYIFYDGWTRSQKGGIGLAISINGYHFIKHAANSVFVAGEKGFDSFSVRSPVIIKDDSLWIMYYNAADLAIYTPGPYIGRATARSLTGDWERSEKPILTAGRRSEWDAGFIFPTSILKLDNGNYIMYYSAGADFIAFKDFHIGMATSSDGIAWTKYNDPSSTEHPFAESDPVLMTDPDKNSDRGYPWSARVYKTSVGYEMYYKIYADICYATSIDGINWKEYPGNPIYTTKDDHTGLSYTDATLEFPSLVFKDSVVFMYFDYGTLTGSIGVAVAGTR